MTDVLLTLGHNASAIAISVGDDGVAKVVNAYELERLSGVKSDSRFPIDAMIALKERGVERFDRVYVTHWDPMNRVSGLKEKYWQAGTFPPEVPVITQEKLGMTHHDCHAAAAVAFAGDDFPKRDSGVLVIDGFGNFAEHLSYYRINGSGKPELVTRLFGYYTSLGLMYQYATAFLGMKMHEDEYKLLGYGARIAAADVNVTRLDEVATREASRHLKAMRNLDPRKLSPALDNLPAVQDHWAKKFQAVMDDLGMEGVDITSFEARCVIGYFVQRVLQMVVENTLRHIGVPTNLIVTGGVALNVELNRMFLRIVPGKLCVMPLAGDQGNSLGLWAAHNKRARLDFGDLCWGKRKFEGVIADVPEGMLVFAEDSDEVYGLLHESLENEGFVNLVRGNMEFGPRALCNTSTLAIASDPNVVAEINRINGRDTVMPFAPVVRRTLMPQVFPGSERLWKSAEFMICAVDYGAGIGEKVPGAALHTAKGEWTGRPQSYEAKYEGDSVARLLDKYGVLINTSFNVHGVPICCDLEHVVHSHQYQRERNPKVRTIVIPG